MSIYFCIPVTLDRLFLSTLKLNRFLLLKFFSSLTSFILLYIVYVDRVIITLSLSCLANLQKHLIKIMLIGDQYVHKGVGEGRGMINYLTIKLM